MRAQIEMKKELLLYPKFFGPNINQLLIDKLHANVEGSCSGRYGFVVCVTEVTHVGKGKIREGQRRTSLRIARGLGFCPPAWPPPVYSPLSRAPSGAVARSLGVRLCQACGRALCMREGMSGVLAV